MSVFKFIHAADLHLDSPLVNLDRYDGAPADELRGATRQALDNLVELAIAEQVRFVLIAGDLFDGDSKDFNTPLYFRKKMLELGGAGIDVYVVQGNHDAQSRMKKAFKLQLPPNVHLFPTQRAGTFELDDVQVAVHGQGFATEAVTDDLSVGLPQPRRDWFNVGLLHTTVNGYDGRGNYAPSTVDGLSAKGYDYWGLGHVHGRAIVRDRDPWIVYAGCVQGRHINEPGEKGCTLVSVDRGQVMGAQPRALDVLRWNRCPIDATDCTTTGEVLRRVGAAIEQEVRQVGDRLVALRIEVTGCCDAHAELIRHPAAFVGEVRDLATDRIGARVWIESVRLRTTSAAPSASATADGVLGSLIEALETPEALAEAVADVRSDLDDLLKKIPTDPRVESVPLDLDCPGSALELAEDVKRLLVPLLAPGRRSS